MNQKINRKKNKQADLPRKTINEDQIRKVQFLMNTATRSGGACGAAVYNNFLAAVCCGVRKSPKITLGKSNTNTFDKKLKEAF